MVGCFLLLLFLVSVLGGGGSHHLFPEGHKKFADFLCPAVLVLSEIFVHLYSLTSPLSPSGLARLDTFFGEGISAALQDKCLFFVTAAFVFGNKWDVYDPQTNNMDILKTDELLRYYMRLYQELAMYKISRLSSTKIPGRRPNRERTYVDCPGVTVTV